MAVNFTYRTVHVPTIKRTKKTGDDVPSLEIGTGYVDVSALEALLKDGERIVSVYPYPVPGWMAAHEALIEAPRKKPV